jgi:hypothetical protein
MMLNSYPRVLVGGCDAKSWENTIEQNVRGNNSFVPEPPLGCGLYQEIAQLHNLPRPKSQLWTNSLLHVSFSSFGAPSSKQSCFSDSEGLQRILDKGIHYYSDSTIGIFIRITVPFFVVALLMILVWLLIFVDIPAVMMLVTVLPFLFLSS